MSRYYIQYADKESFVERFHVVDARSNRVVTSEPLPRDQAQARKRELEASASEHLEPISPWLGGWRG